MGDSCQCDEDVCAGETCFNGGTCSKDPSGGNYLCACVPGITLTASLSKCNGICRVINPPILLTLHVG